MRTKKEIFEIVENHLLKQASKAERDWNGGKICAYLDPETGKKCAVGALIPDGHPAQEYLGDVGNLIEEYNDDTELLNALGIDLDSDNDSIKFLENLQHVHDIAPEDQWKWHLQYIKKQFHI